MITLLAFTLIMINMTSAEVFPNETPAQETQLHMAGFYPFVAPLPIWTFDVPENYAAQSSNDTTLANAVHPLDHNIMLRLSHDTNSGIVAVALHDYLLLENVDTTCPSQEISYRKDPTNPGAYIINDARHQCNTVSNCGFFVLAPQRTIFCTRDAWTIKLPRLLQKEHHIVGVKKTTLYSPSFSGYDFECNTDSSCPDPFILDKRKGIATTTAADNSTQRLLDSLATVCNANSRCQSFKAIPVVTRDGNLEWETTYCSVITAGIPHARGHLYAIKRR